MVSLVAHTVWTLEWVTCGYSMATHKPLICLSCLRSRFTCWFIPHSIESSINVAIVICCLCNLLPTHKLPWVGCFYRAGDLKIWMADSAVSLSQFTIHSEWISSSKSNISALILSSKFPISVQFQGGIGMEFNHSSINWYWITDSWSDLQLESNLFWSNADSRYQYFGWYTIADLIISATLINSTNQRALTHVNERTLETGIQPFGGGERKMYSNAL